MKYTTENLLISLQRELADKLLEAKYNVLWYATGETENPTLGEDESAKDTVTLIPEFPVNPTFMARRPGPNSSVTAEQGKVFVPAFAVSLLDGAKRISRAGIGMVEFERWLLVRFDGFAYDKFQQRALQDLLYEWLTVENTTTRDIRIPVLDYSTDPDDPDELDSAEVIDAVITKEELVTEIEAIRYGIHASVIISYFE
jgi:hypothetical protein